MSEDLLRRIQKLEEVHAHQEHLLLQLNEEVIRMQQEFAAQNAKWRQQVQRLESAIEAIETPPDPNEKPPHY